MCAGLSVPGLAQTLCLGVALCAGTAGARSIETDAGFAMRVFADHCFSPFLTASRAAKVLQTANGQYDFYDLDPFSNAAPSPATGRPATPGTDRRCEVAFLGDFATEAARTAIEALAAEGILTEAPLPPTHAAAPGTELIAARRLNPKRVAVVHVGTRPADRGVETFMNVERLTPSASQY